MHIAHHLLLRLYQGAFWASDWFVDIDDEHDNDDDDEHDHDHGVMCSALYARPV